MNNNEKLNQEANLIVDGNENAETKSTGTKSKEKTAPKTSMIQSIINTIASGVADLVEKQPARKDVESKMRSVLTTVFALASLDEYAVGMRIGDTLYRYSDYQGPASFNDLIPAKRVVLADVPSAKNFIKTSVYKGFTEAPLDPSAFLTNVKVIMKALRVNTTLVPLSRSDSDTLTNATKSACDSGKVEDRNTKSLVFLDAKFDDEKQVSVIDWAKTRATTLFE